MNATLHQHPGSAHLQRLGDLLVNLFELEDVALLRRGALQRPVESAERAVFSAKVGVVDVAVDDVRDHTLGMDLTAHSIRLKAQAN